MDSSLPTSSHITNSVRLYHRNPQKDDKNSAPKGGLGDIFMPKLFTVLDRNYWRTQFVKDLMSGIIVGVVALPLAIAFGIASGVTPDKGLATAIVAGFLISFFGGSRVQIGGPTGAFIVIVYGVIAQYGLNGLLVSTMLAGVFLIGFGLLRLGNVIKFIPHPVIVGFTSGIAVTIFSTQIKDALGLRMAEVPETFIAKWGAYFSHMSTAQGWSVGVTAATLAIILAGRKFFPRVPGSLVAIILTSAAVGIWRLPVETIGSRFGAISSSLSLSMPTFSLSELGGYVQPAFIIALLCAIESLLSAVVADGMIGDEHRSNTELIAQGLANIVTPFFGGIPATGALARTVTNVKSGGRTPVAGLVHALVLLAITLALGEYAALIPMSCLAGVLIVVAYNMSEWRAFRAVLRAPWCEVVVLLATFFLTVLVDLTVAIEIGMVLTAFMFIQRMASLGEVFSVSVPTADRQDGEQLDDYGGLPPGVDVFEISGPFFFAAARRYQQVMQNLGEGSRIVIIRMRHVPFIDATGIRLFREAVEFMTASGRRVLLTGISDAVMQDLRRYGFIQTIGANNIFPSFADAVNYIAIHPEINDELPRATRSGSTVRMWGPRPK